jgi:hypothetical protein
MSEETLRDLFDRVLAAPGPPGADREQMVARAHRALVRRRVVRSAGAAGVGLACVVVVALAVGVASGHRGDAIGVATNAPPAPTTVTPTVTQSPPADVGGAQQLLDALTGLVPAQFSLPDQAIFTDGGGQKYQLFGSQEVPSGTDTMINASTVVFRDGKQASLSVLIAPATAQADLCLAQVVHQGIEAGCHVSTAQDGTPIRVAWRDINGLGRIWYATRFYGSRSVTVSQAPGGIRPGMGNYGAVWTEPELVEVAASPVLQPYRYGRSD